MAKVEEAAAGYMELKGAVKDSDCKLVNVKGGVSSRLGCCNLFEPESESTDEFRCGECSYLSSRK